jgi:hypothetical protein
MWFAGVIYQLSSHVAEMRFSHGRRAPDPHFRLRFCNGALTKPLLNFPDQATYDQSRFLQTIEARLQASLAHTSCYDRYIGGATVAEVANPL